MENPGEADQQHGLDDDQADDAAGEPKRIAQQLAHVDIHADGEEEDAEQQSLERLDGRLDRLAVFGLGEQQAGDEGAERHGQAGLIGNDAGGDDDEQNDGDEQLGGTRVRHQPEQRPQQHAAEDDDDGNAQSRPEATPCRGS